ncbi:RIIa domain-containing protein 1-like [Oscarella lobularis]|uniref:RIIa domain-containing protein 1-like n=1 Tax=Oscarella lobularis TaxID=121494 RepID=UPI003313BA7B
MSDPLKGVRLQSVENHDAKALTEEQQAKLDKKKIRTRIENEAYLRNHPEVTLLLSGFMKEVLIKRPENVRQFAAEHFSQPELADSIQEHVKEHRNVFKARKMSQAI